MPRCSSPAARHPTFSVWSAVGGVWRSGWSLLEIDVQGRIGAELVRKSVARLCSALLIASTGSRLQRIYSALRRVLVSRRARAAVAELEWENGAGSGHAWARGVFMLPALRPLAV